MMRCSSCNLSHRAHSHVYAVLSFYAMWSTVLSTSVCHCHRNSAAALQMMKGMCGGNEEQAAVMASQLKKMSPGQVRMLTKAAGVVQGGVQTARKAREWLAGNLMLVAAVVLLLIAILLRWYGIM